MRTGRRVLLSVSVLAGVLACVGQSVGPAAQVTFLFRSGSTVVGRVEKFDGNLLVVEDNNHRIVIADRHGDVKGQIGSIGQAPGDLYYPGDLVRGKNGNLYVLEVRNRRIQIFDPAGHSLKTFHVNSEPTGMAVDSRGQVLLGQPASGALISVYSPDGRRVRTFGDLRLVSEFYGAQLLRLNRSAREAINRVHILCDGLDNIYVSFLGAPFWQKYSPDGRLLFEHRIEFPDAQREITEFASSLKAHSTVKFDEDQSAIPYITTGMTIDGLQRLVFSVRWDRSWIVESNLDGTKERAFPLEDSDLQIRTLSSDGDSRVFAIGAKPGHNNEVYSITVPQGAEDST
jgi:hypothetical protein